MRSWKPAMLIIILLVGVFASSEATPLSASGTERGVAVLKPFSPSSRPSQTSSEQEAIPKKCVEAEERLQEDIAAMVPGRSSTWQSDVERSRKHLDGLKRSVAALRDCEGRFEAYLTPERTSSVASELRFAQGLLHRLESNAQSLDVELGKRYPARWHVAQDVSSMQTAIRNLRKLHEQITIELDVNRNK